MLANPVVTAILPQRKEPDMELTYRKCGDYYIPDIALNDTEDYQLADIAGCGNAT